MPFELEPLPGRAFLPFPGAEDFLRWELSARFSLETPDASFGDLLYFADAEGIEPYWSACTLLSPARVRFDSISGAAQALRSMQRNWAFYPACLFRRGTLIQEKLPRVNLKPKLFPYEAPSAPIGCFCLESETQMIASAATSSPFPLGRLAFIEDHEQPPSRAYLKLWEALCLFQYWFGAPPPNAESRCLDAGASPGGWTWVLDSLGARVLAVDRSPLAPSLAGRANIRFLRHDAFTLKPEELGPMDWVFSDVICYPARLLEWIRRWLDSGLCRNMICTIKMQGEIDWALIREFASLPSSRVAHLNYNKHELCFFARTAASS